MLVRRLLVYLRFWQVYRVLISFGESDVIMVPSRYHNIIQSPYEIIIVIIFLKH